MQFSHTIQLFETDPLLVGNFFDAIISLDRNLTITFWNYGAEVTFGYSREEAIGKNFESIISPNHFDIKITTITSTLIDNQEWRGEIIHKKKDESLIGCVVSVSQVKGRDGRLEYLLISRDVSDRKELENFQRLNENLEEQLNSKKVKLTNFFERINHGFFFLDNDWHYTHVNKKAAALLGREPSALIGKHVWTEFPAFGNTAFVKVYAKAMQTQQYIHIEEYSDMLDRWFQVDVYPSGKRLAVFFRDISEEKNTERQIKESEELYRKIVETLQEGILMINTNNIITFVNASMERMLGYARDEMIGKDFRDFLQEDSPPLVLKNIRSGQFDITGNNDIALTTKDGDEIWVVLTSSPIYKKEGYAGMLAMVMDITERKKKEQELKDSHQQLRHLASRLQSIREEERASLAREIHDELGQQLTALKMDIYWLCRNLPSEDARLRTKTEGIMKLVNETLPKIEKKAIELHPSLLHDLGLLAAIEWQNKQFQSRSEATIHFNAVGSDECLSKDVAVALYRIYQEALTNVTRHASASEIATMFIQCEGTVELTISDNGKGFDTRKMDKKKSLGLLSMKERCIMIGGKCEITSVPGKGTVVSVKVPLKTISSNGV